MDVQAATPTLSSTTFTLPPAPTGSDAAAPLPGLGSGGSAPLPGTSVPDGSSGGSGSTGSAASTPGLALLPPHGGPAPAQSGSESLPGNVGKLYGLPSNATSVSFQPAAGSSEIVTVITNTQTGKVVAQFPSETLVALAQFFQKLDNTSADSGAVVDKKV